MAKKFILFTIKKRISLVNKIQKFALNSLPIIIIITALIIKINYLIVVVLLFISLMALRILKVRKPEQIDVCFDHLIFTNQNKKLEIDFYLVEHIDVDVQELPNGEKYIKELVLLSGNEQELLSLDGEGYDKEHLEFLISRILEYQSTILRR